MDTFYQVLEDHVEPRSLSDFFAFAHSDALATGTDSCPKLHTDKRDFTRAINKAIGGTSTPTEQTKINESHNRINQ